jgi:hypothetical protein
MLPPNLKKPAAPAKPQEITSEVGFIPINASILDGASGKFATFTGTVIKLTVNPNGTIADLKKRIQLQRNVSPDKIDVMFNGALLDNDQILASAGIHENVTIHVLDMTHS